MSNRREYEQALAAEFERHGIEFRFEMGGKHPRAVFLDREGRKQVFPYPGTPSGVDILNYVTELRRRIGVERVKVEAINPVRRRRKPRSLVMVPELLPITVRDNPMVVLKTWKPPPRMRWVKITNRIWRVEILG